MGAPSGIRKFLGQLGPGVITGASDDDPSGIATYSQAGAAYRFDTLWTLLFSFPLMYAIQAISARIGRTTGHGLATNLRRHYPGWLFYCIVAPMAVANVINIGADLAAMGDAAALLAGKHGKEAFTLGFGLLCLALILLVPYSRYANVLKWLTLSLFAYIAVLFTVQIPWGTVAQATLLPAMHLDSKYITVVVAILGTTISPYLFFWQASQEVEEIRKEPLRDPLIHAPEQAPAELSRIRIDTLVGMGFSTVIAYCIMVSTAATLNMHGVTDIQTTAQAAEALRPVAGRFAFWLFAGGLIGTGLLGVPILAASAAYGIAGTFRWKNSLEHKPLQAPQFYTALALAILLGMAMNIVHIDPIKALFWSAVINGVVAVPVMWILMLLSANRNAMGDFTVHGSLRWLGWLATLAMAAAVVAMFVFM
ncbi:NRAMP family divalent metal transporter [Amantichitinum ursilacus]|uniref:Divalent metal cation transporter MntH n=1 Tax=Amantichitinum ursilacus TaxID=857265 RepID=A0A0N0GQ14_9NEIS|nr:divalent metal cation transporter [Amantichitinum ursilacus]KPC54215.1 Divalent metal cation transporter MntH [Amantichitinum ursilacus]